MDAQRRGSILGRDLPVLQLRLERLEQRVGNAQRQYIDYRRDCILRQPKRQAGHDCKSTK